MITLLGVTIEAVSRREVIARTLHASDTCFVVNLNPEILLYAWRHPQYRDILNRAQIKIIDGVGVVLMARFLYGVKLTRFPGADLANEIIKWASENNKNIFLLGGSQKANEKAIQTLATDYRLPVTRIKGLGGEFTEKEAIKEINEFKPDILFVALGAPKQEIFIFNLQPTTSPSQIFGENLGGQDLQPIMMGIGGAIDYWAYPKLRAPNIARRLGFEWLWRVMLQPWRLFRIFKAVILFPLACIWEKIYVK